MLGCWNVSKFYKNSAEHWVLYIFLRLQLALINILPLLSEVEHWLYLQCFFFPILSLFDLEKNFDTSTHLFAKKWNCDERDGDKLAFFN